MPSNRLLIIDDEPDIAATIGRVARRCGYDAIVTTDPDEFMARVREWKPDVVVLDLAMPELDGLGLLNLLGREACPAQILIVSGHDAAVLDNARRFGRDSGLAIAGTLQKPLRVEALRAAFDSINEAAGIITRVDVASALALNEFSLVYEPKIDLRTMRVYGVEALSRWKHPARGPVSPLTFIPLIEELNLINEFTAGVIERAVRQLQQWRDGGSDLGIAINISAKNLGSFDLDGLIRDRCSAYGVDISRITIELTESAAMEHAETGDSLMRLVEFGAQLSIDDFGTGYSSLVQLQRLPFAELKIDKSFVMGCLQDKRKQVIVRAIVDLAHNMDLKAIAEGVETIEILDHLRQLGCDSVQGWYFTKPLLADELAAWVTQWNGRKA